MLSLAVHNYHTDVSIATIGSLPLSWDVASLVADLDIQALLWRVSAGEVFNCLLGFLFVTFQFIGVNESYFIITVHVVFMVPFVFTYNEHLLSLIEALSPFRCIAIGAPGVLI